MAKWRSAMLMIFLCRVSVGFGFSFAFLPSETQAESDLYSDVQHCQLSQSHCSVLAGTEAVPVLSD